MAGSRKTRAEAGGDRVVRVRSDAAVLVRKDRRSFVMERRVVDLMEGWGEVKADVEARMAKRAVLRKVFMVLSVCCAVWVVRPGSVSR